jgi:hypothetical protein
VTVNADGFSPNEPVLVYLEGTLLTPGVASPTGSVSVHFATPNQPNDIYRVTVLGTRSGLAAEAPLLTIRGSWAQTGHDASHSYDNPGANTLTAANVSRVVPMWSAPGGDGTDSLVANGLVYTSVPDPVGFEQLEVLPAAGCEASPCAPAWVSSPGTGGSPFAVTAKTVFVTTYDQFGNGYVAAFPAAGCGQPQCSPKWVTASPANGPVLVGSQIVGTAFGTNPAGVRSGSLLYYSANGCGSGQCAPVGTGTTTTPGCAATAGCGTVSGAVSNGTRIFASGDTTYSLNDQLLALPASCSGTCAPTVDFGQPGAGGLNMAPTAVQGSTVYTLLYPQFGPPGQSLTLEGLSPQECASPCTASPLWTLSGQGLNFLAVADPFVYSSLAVYNPTGCQGSGCPLAWAPTTSNGGQPIIAGGLEYAQDGTSIAVYPATACAPTCLPIAELSYPGATVTSAAAVVGGTVFATATLPDGSNTVVAFGLPD